MNEKEMTRLRRIDERVREIAEEWGLLTTDVIFEIVPAQRVLEGMAYNFPVNFSHWSFGRDYEKHRTIYEHTGQGIPYEQVWNFETPKAFLVETNPFALNSLVIAHVYGHVDFFLGSRYCLRGRALSDVAEEARRAASRFAEYEKRYGKHDVEKLIDAGMSIQWHQNPDPFFEEQDEESVREWLIEWEHAKLGRTKEVSSEFAVPKTEQEVRDIELRLEGLLEATPPEPTYDLLHYIINQSPKLKKPWMKDVLSVVRNQARALAPLRRTKMLNEGWATYWHTHIMRRLFEERLLTEEEHGTFLRFHSGVTRFDKMSFNWYRVGSAFFEHVKERWDKGQFGKAYLECEDPHKRAEWDTGAMDGTKKIFEIRTSYSDRMAVEVLFSDDFIREQELYIYSGIHDPETGEAIYFVSEDDPKKIRAILKASMTHYGIPPIVVQNGDVRKQKHLLLRHEFPEYELDPVYRDATMKNIQNLWGRIVYLMTISEGEEKVFSCSGKEVKEVKLSDLH